MRKRERELRQMIADEGLMCEDFGMTGSGHYYAKVRAPNGACQKVFMSNTPSEGRGELNKRSDLRRFASNNANRSCAQ